MSLECNDCGRPLVDAERWAEIENHDGDCECERCVSVCLSSRSAFDCESTFARAERKSMKRPLAPLAPVDPRDATIASLRAALAASEEKRRVAEEKLANCRDTIDTLVKHRAERIALANAISADNSHLAGVRHALNVFCRAFDLGGVSCGKLCEMLGHSISDLHSAGAQAVANAIVDAADSDAALAQHAIDDDQWQAKIDHARFLSAGWRRLAKMRTGFLDAEIRANDARTTSAEALAASLRANNHYLDAVFRHAVDLSNADSALFAATILGNGPDISASQAKWRDALGKMEAAIREAEENVVRTEE